MRRAILPARRRPRVVSRRSRAAACASASRQVQQLGDVAHVVGQRRVVPALRAVARHAHRRQRSSPARCRHAGRPRCAPASPASARRAAAYCRSASSMFSTLRCATAERSAGSACWACDAARNVGACSHTSSSAKSCNKFATTCRIAASGSMRCTAKPAQRRRPRLARHKLPRSRAALCASRPPGARTASCGPRHGRTGRCPATPAPRSASRGRRCCARCLRKPHDPGFSVISPGRAPTPRRSKCASTASSAARSSSSRSACPSITGSGGGQNAVHAARSGERFGQAGRQQGC